MKRPRNFLFGYLNKNSLRNRVLDLKQIARHVQFEYFGNSETKLDLSFPSAQFKLTDHEIRARRDRDENGDGIIDYVLKGVICKRLKKNWHYTKWIDLLWINDIILKMVLYQHMSHAALRKRTNFLWRNTALNK